MLIDLNSLNEFPGKHAFQLERTYEAGYSSEPNMVEWDRKLGSASYATL